MSLLEGVGEGPLRISATAWPSSTFNRFEGSSLVKPCTVGADFREYQTTFLLDSGAQGYAFVDEKVARDICEALQITPVKLPREKHLNKFDGTRAKPVTHVILPSLTVQDHSELSAPMFITKIGSHPIILGKPWINRHKVIIDGKDDSIHFKPGRCDHARLNPRPKPDKTRPPKELWLPPPPKPRETSPPASPQKYRILQRREAPLQPNSEPKQAPPRPTVEDSDEEEEMPQKDSLGPDSPWSLMPASEHTSLTNSKEPPPAPRKTPSERRAEAIAKHQNSKVVLEPPARRPSKTRRPRLPGKPSEPDGAPNDDSPLQIGMIGAASFLRQARRTGKKKPELFSMTIQQIRNVIAKAKEPSEQASEPNQSHLEISTMDMKEIMKKCPEFLRKFTKVLNPKEAEHLPAHGPYDHKIELTGDPSTLPKSRVYPLSPKKWEALEKYLSENLNKGFISPSKAERAAPILFALKPNGQLRFCVDYRKLNAITKRNGYPIPLIEETLARVVGCKHISKLDIIAAFNKLRMDPASEELTTFITALGTYKYHVMPFGLTGGPASWQNYMNDLLFDFLNKFCQVYMDDILIYSKTRREHREHLEQVFTRLEQAGLQVDINKCEFFKTEVTFLGVILSIDGLRMDPKKIQDIVDWAQPTCLKDVQAFVGFCNFYRRFIRGFSKIAKALTRMARKEAGFDWTAEANEAFEALKKRVTEAPVLRHYDRSRKAVLECDSSDWCLGGVLSQYDDEGDLHPVAFFSKKMIPAECNYEIYDKELLAIIRCLEHWRPELEGTDKPVEIYTDHKGLETFMISKKLTPRQVRWAEILADYNIQIQYQSGAKNAKADALTRMPGYRPDEDDERQRYREQVLLPPSRIQLDALSLCPIDAEDDLYERVLEANKEDKDCNAYREALEAGETAHDGISLADCEVRDGALFKNGNLWVPGQMDLLLEIIRDAHDQPSVAHSGMNRTQELIKRYYYWPSMRDLVKRYIGNCHSCRRAKSAHDGRIGLLRPLPIPRQRWVDISMDFVVGLPNSEGHNAICTIIDRLTKERHYAPCTATDEGTAVGACVRILLHYVFRTHGLPSTIVSDRGRQFVSAVWDRFCKRLGIKCKLSSAHHPQTDGQTERANQDIETRLRHYCNYAQDDWAQWIDILEFADNNSLANATDLTPFFANKGYHPRMTFGPSLKDPESTRERLLMNRADNIADEMERIVTYARENAIQAGKIMTAQANKHRRPVEYEIGDYVWLDRRNIKTARPSDKLDDKYLGPYLVTKKRGQAYELELPETMQIHPVFHSWLLRKDPQDPLPGQQNEPPGPVRLGENPEWQVDDIVGSRYHYHRLQYRANWTGYPHDRTWYYADGGQFVNAQDVVNEYHRLNPRAAGPALRDD